VRRSHGSWALQWAALTTAAVVTLAGCGSTAETTTGGQGAGPEAPQAVEAQETISHLLNPPGQIELPEPLSKTPERGKTFVYLSCDSDQCAYGAKTAKVATEALGWDLEVVQYKNADPKTLIAAMDQALQYDPVGVSFFALPEALWKQEVDVYEKAGVPLIPISVGEVSFNQTVPTNIYPPAQGTTMGTAVGNWVIADSNAKAKVLVFNVPEFGTIQPFVEAFKKSLQEGCNECEVTDLNATIAQVGAGQVNDLIVSALQRNPDIKYVVTAGGTLIHGLPSALNAAGIKVSLAGGSPTVEEQEYIRAGNSAAFTSYPLNDAVWEAIDAAARVSVGDKVPQTYPTLPFMLLTPETIKEVPTGVSHDFPEDYQQAFKSLWQVG